MKRSRRKFTAEFKLKVAIEAIKEIKIVYELAQTHRYNERKENSSIGKNPPIIVLQRAA